MSDLTDRFNITQVELGRACDLMMPFYRIMTDTADQNAAVRIALINFGALTGVLAELGGGKLVFEALEDAMSATLRAIAPEGRG